MLENITFTTLSLKDRFAMTFCQIYAGESAFKSWKIIFLCFYTLTHVDLNSYSLTVHLRTTWGIDGSSPF